MFIFITIVGGGGALIRRPASGKHYSLSIETPISKVINIILAAQENQPSYIVQALDKVNVAVVTAMSVQLCSVR